jgi:hypothetical protein
LPKAENATELLLYSLRRKADKEQNALDHPEVQPDNNHSERSLQLTATKSKICGTSWSMTVFAQTAILLTAIDVGFSCSGPLRIDAFLTDVYCNRLI